MGIKVLNLNQQTFGSLEVMERLENDKHGKSRWKCKCRCGNIKAVRGSDLVSGKTTSCGCNKARHNLTNHKLYKTWYDMKNRCMNSKLRAYKNYGGRGIKVCEEWRCNFRSFYFWAVNFGYRPELTLDRIDVNGDYSPENCKWSTYLEQNQNKRNVIQIEHKGSVKTVAAFARDNGVSKHVLYKKLKKGLSIQEIMNGRNIDENSIFITQYAAR